MSFPTREDAVNAAQALAAAGFLEAPVTASFRAFDGYRAYTASSQIEARRWLNFNRDFSYPGSDQID
jgi:hypothetical protein